MRSKYRSVDAIPITTRQLESMVRLSEARARAELREKVTQQDAEEVIEIIKNSLWESYQDENGRVDFQRSQHGTGMSKKGNPKKFIAELNKICFNSATNRFTYDQLYKIAQGLLDVISGLV